MNRAAVAAGLGLAALLTAGPVAASSPHDSAPVQAPADPVAFFAEALTAALDPAQDFGAGYLDGFAPDSPAHTYFEGLVLLGLYGHQYPESERGACGYRVDGDTLAPTGECPTLSSIATNESGLISTFTRDGTPISDVMFPVGEVAASPGGTVFTVHDVRTWSAVMIVLAIDNREGAVEASVHCNRYVTDEGRQLEPTRAIDLGVDNAFPGALVAGAEVFETDRPGTAHCAAFTRGDVFWSMDFTVQVAPVEASQ